MSVGGCSPITSLPSELFTPLRQRFLNSTHYSLQESFLQKAIAHANANRFQWEKTLDQYELEPGFEGSVSFTPDDDPFQTTIFRTLKNKVKIAIPLAYLTELDPNVYGALKNSFIELLVPPPLTQPLELKFLICQSPKKPSAVITRSLIIIRMLEEERKKHKEKHIPKTYSIHSTDSFFCIRQSFYLGGDLYNWFLDSSSTNLQDSIILRVMISAARGLKFLQNILIVHKDLACGNIVFRQSPEKDKDPVVLIDWDLAEKFNEVNCDRPASGNPHTIAPEVLKNSAFKIPYTADIPPKIDIWSFGIVLVCLLCRVPNLLFKDNLIFSPFIDEVKQELEAEGGEVKIDQKFYNRVLAKYLKFLTNAPPKSLKQFFEEHLFRHMIDPLSEQMKPLLRTILKANPLKRPSIDTILTKLEDLQRTISSSEPSSTSSPSTSSEASS